eukprot:TCONS_00073764-protein
MDAQPWGILFPFDSNKYMYANLTNQGETKFGRAPTCDYMFHKDTLTLKEYMNISKVHFTISRQHNGTVWIKNHGLNGTFVNGEHIGNNINYPLTHNSIIAMALSENRVFTFLNQENLREE